MYLMLYMSSIDFDECRAQKSCNSTHHNEKKPFRYENNKMFGWIQDQFRIRFNKVKRKFFNKKITSNVFLSHTRS